MTTKLMQLDIVDSEKEIFSGEVEFLVANGEEGELGIFPNHIPFITRLKPGVIRFKLANQEFQQVFAISGGFLEVLSNHVNVLADIVERTEQLDESRLQTQLQEAKARLKRSGDSSLTIDVAKAQASLEIAIAQLKALDYIKKQAKR